MWLIVLSDQLPVFGLVSRYLTNYLIGRETIPQQRAFTQRIMRSKESIRY